MPSYPTAAWVLATKINVIATASALNSGVYRTSLRPLGTCFDDMDSCYTRSRQIGGASTVNQLRRLFDAMLLAPKQTLTSV
jgi:hypothetical protein